MNKRLQEMNKLPKTYQNGAQMGTKMDLKSEKGRKKGIQKSMLKIDAEKNRRDGLLGSVFTRF